MAAPDDPALRGCWRSQHVQVLLADQSHYDQNGDCVTEYDGAKARSRWHSSAERRKEERRTELAR
jgi:hypothetical protein